MPVEVYGNEFEAQGIYCDYLELSNGSGIAGAVVKICLSSS